MDNAFDLAMRDAIRQAVRPMVEEAIAATADKIVRDATVQGLYLPAVLEAIERLPHDFTPTHWKAVAISDFGQAICEKRHKDLHL